MDNCCEKPLDEMLIMTEFLNNHYETLSQLARKDEGVSNLVSSINTSLELLVKGVYREITRSYNAIIASRDTGSRHEEKEGTEDARAGRKTESDSKPGKSQSNASGDARP